MKISPAIFSHINNHRTLTKYKENVNSFDYSVADDRTFQRMPHGGAWQAVYGTV